jgi:hypothetical protein
VTIPLRAVAGHRNRFVAASFARVDDYSDPADDRPDIDDRDTRAPELGGVVGVMVGRTVRVSLVRGIMPSRATVFVTSSDPSVMRVDGSSQRPSRWPGDVTIVGVDGGAESRDAKLEVRLGAVDGVIVAFLTVRVFVERNVDLTFHRVQLVHGTGAERVTGGVPVADVAQIMQKVRAIWCHYGITFDSSGGDTTEELTVPNVTRMRDDPWPGDLPRVLALNHVPNTINVYLVERIGTGDTLGYGISRASAREFGLPHPGIVLADQSGSPRFGVMHWANDLAHEIGHFFGLWHVDKREPPRELQTYWARRQLMHNFNGMRASNVWPAPMSNGRAYRNRPMSDDVGYGEGCRGCLVTLKATPHTLADNQAATARATISSAAGPY